MPTAATAPERRAPVPPPQELPLPPGHGGRVLVCAIGTPRELNGALRAVAHDRLIVVWGSRLRGLTALRRFLRDVGRPSVVVRADDGDLVAAVGSLVQLLQRLPKDEVTFHCGHPPLALRAACCYVALLHGIPLHLDGAAGVRPFPVLRAGGPGQRRGVGRDQARILRLLRDHEGPLRQTQVSRRLRLLRGTLVPHLEALASQGWLLWERQPPAKVSLTPLGRTIAPLLLGPQR